MGLCTQLGQPLSQGALGDEVAGVGGEALEGLVAAPRSREWLRHLQAHGEDGVVRVAQPLERDGVVGPLLEVYLYGLADDLGARARALARHLVELGVAPELSERATRRRPSAALPPALR